MHGEARNGNRDRDEDSGLLEAEVRVRDHGAVRLLETRSGPVGVFGTPAWELLDRRLADAEQDPDVRVMVLATDGASFCAGGDLRELAALAGDGPRLDALLDRWRVPLRRVERCSKPVVAALHGDVLGGGFELALTAHLRVADPGTRFGFPEARRLGTIPVAGGTLRLARVVGRSTALDLLLTGRSWSAEEAWRAGIVHRLADDPRAAALQLAGEIARAAPEATRAVLELVGAGTGIGQIDHADALERRWGLHLIGSDDAADGFEAFFTRREPAFQEVRDGRAPRR